MRSLSRTLRRATGVYYTPAPLIDFIIGQTLGPLLRGITPRQEAILRIIDPACGAGDFLVRAYQYLLDWHRDQCPNGSQLTPAARQRLLHTHIFGVDIDPQAVQATSALLQMARGDEPTATTRQSFTTRSLSRTIRCGNSLIGPDVNAKPCRQLTVFDWQGAFPAVLQAGGFDVVLGNPPWGQKRVAADPALKRYLARSYPSSAGIFDLFRPFVELGVRLTRQGGMFGMVLPDIVLLKDYPHTRRYLLDQLSLTAIDWWGQAFADAVIDTVTIAGRKGPAPDNHGVRVGIHDPDQPLRHVIPQADFRANPRHLFNLFLTPARRHVLDRLAACPRLGDYFEIHEGVHSGNIRAELFVPRALDATCRPLLFGRDEIAPYRLCWRGRYVRLGVVPPHKSRRRYANLGRPEWHERAKVLVRRTGDVVLAAVDRQGRYASNNFFVVFPSRPCSLDLDGLCALLNSRFMTWYFRAIEPRQGRVFSELKIKHLRTFPLPRQVLTPDGCRRLNELGAQRAGCPDLDGTINDLMQELFGVALPECGVPIH